MYIYILLLAEYEICLSKHTHTHWWSPVTAPWSIPWPSGPAGRAGSAADANGWSRPVDGTSTSTIGKAGRFFHKSLGVGKVGKVCHSFFGGWIFWEATMFDVWRKQINSIRMGQNSVPQNWSAKQTEFSCFVSPLEKTKIVGTQIAPKYWYNMGITWYNMGISFTSHTHIIPILYRYYTHITSWGRGL